jgi:hypothetical protein
MDCFARCARSAAGYAWRESSLLQFKNFILFSGLLWRILRRLQLDQIGSGHGHIVSVAEARK